jgi:hypothetical protein
MPQVARAFSPLSLRSARSMEEPVARGRMSFLRAAHKAQGLIQPAAWIAAHRRGPAPGIDTQRSRGPPGWVRHRTRRRAGLFGSRVPSGMSTPPAAVAPVNSSPVILSASVALLICHSPKPRNWIESGRLAQHGRAPTPAPEGRREGLPLTWRLRSAAGRAGEYGLSGRSVGPKPLFDRGALPGG